MKLLEFLNKKPLFYKEIDYDRMPRVFEKFKNKLSFSLNFVVHIIGTNGKGSTGRFVSSYLHNANFSTIHYSSPHIFSFNERIFINGENIDDDSLEKYHIKLFDLLGEDDRNSLSYFEYTTLLVFLIAFEKKIDFLILEAGLGGVGDATSVVKKDLSLITPIGYDHKEFLGDTLEKIATSKIKCINNIAIINNSQKQEVFTQASKIANDNNFTLLQSEDIVNSYNKDMLDELKKILTKKNLPFFQYSNLALALSALIMIQKKINININNIDLNKFSSSTINFRCEKIYKNIFVDVGHNQLASLALLEHFKNKKINLIFNTFANKDYTATLQSIKPIVDSILYLEIDDEKMIDYKSLENTCKQLDLKIEKFQSIDEQKEYLVFGSFLCVENFMKKYPKK